MTIGVKILHLTVIGPLVRHVESGTNGTSIGIDTALLEQIHVQLFVQVVHRVVESEQDNLGHLFHGHISGNVLTAAEAIGQQTHVLAALGSQLVGRRCRINGLWTSGWEAVDVNSFWWVL